MKQAYGILHGNHARLFITLDIDTVKNSGKLTLPEYSLTKVSRNAAWEYCLYIKGLSDYGIYQFANNSITTNPTPLGMGVEIENGPEKMIKITVAKSLISNPQVVRFVITTEKPNFRNPGKRNHGSSSIDIFPGQGEFPGRVPGFVQVFTPQDDTTDAIQVIDPITYYFYDGINPITEVDDYGAVTANYVYAGGLHVARVTSDTFWYHCDALGSPRVMTDTSGSQVWNCFYYPFGEQKWPESEQISNSHQFTGKEYDTDMSLNYFCQRYYDPTIGRFMSLDPERPAASSPYAYCANNPLKYIDPTGMSYAMQYSRDFGFETWFERHANFMEYWNLFNVDITKARNSQLAPEIFGEGWHYTNMEIIYHTLLDIKYSKWGQTDIGTKVVAILMQLYKEKGIIIDPAVNNWCNTCNYTINIHPLLLTDELRGDLALSLVHEGGHLWSLPLIQNPGHYDFHRDKFIAYRLPEGWTLQHCVDLWEGTALLVEASYMRMSGMPRDAGILFTGRYHNVIETFFANHHGTLLDRIIWMKQKCY